jgi:hypothetical protein
LTSNYSEIAAPSWIRVGDVPDVTNRLRLVEFFYLITTAESLFCNFSLFIWMNLKIYGKGRRRSHEPLYNKERVAQDILRQFFHKADPV